MTDPTPAAPAPATEPQPDPWPHPWPKHEFRNIATPDLKPAPPFDVPTGRDGQMIKALLSSGVDPEKVFSAAEADGIELHRDGRDAATYAHDLAYLGPDAFNPAKYTFGNVLPAEIYDRKDATTAVPNFAKKAGEAFSNMGMTPGQARSIVEEMFKLGASIRGLNDDQRALHLEAERRGIEQDFPGEKLAEAKRAVVGLLAAAGDNDVTKALRNTVMANRAYFRLFHAHALHMERWLATRPKA